MLISRLQWHRDGGGEGVDSLSTQPAITVVGRERGVVLDTWSVWKSYGPSSVGLERSADSQAVTIAGVCIICACLPVCWPLASPLFSKIRGSTVSFRDHWRSRRSPHSPHSYGTNSVGEKSRMDNDRSESAYTPGPPDTDLLSVSRQETSPDAGGYVAYPQQVRAVSSSDSEDGILIIQGGHNEDRYRHLRYDV